MILFSSNAKNLKYVFDLSLKLSEPVIFPTDTIFGIGASISNIKANTKIYDIKKRDKDKPFPILVSDINMATSIAKINDITDDCKNVLKNGFKKQTTYIFYAQDSLDPIFKKDSKVAIRIPISTYLIDLISSIKTPITATSVNIQNSRSINNINDIINNFKNELSLYINGLTISNSSSEIIDLTGKSPKKIR